MEANCPGDSLGWYLRHSTTLTLELAEHVRAGNSALNHLEGGALPEWCHLETYLVSSTSHCRRLSAGSTSWGLERRSEFQRSGLKRSPCSFLFWGCCSATTWTLRILPNIIVLCKMAYTLQPSSWTKSFEDFIYWKKTMISKQVLLDFRWSRDLDGTYLAWLQSFRWPPPGALFASVALEAPVNLGAGEVVLWVSLGAKKLCIFSRHLDFNHVWGQSPCFSGESLAAIFTTTTNGDGFHKPPMMLWWFLAFFKPPPYRMMSGMSAPKMFSSVSTSAWDTQLAGAMGQWGSLGRLKDEKTRRLAFRKLAFGHHSFFS